MHLVHWDALDKTSHYTLVVCFKESSNQYASLIVESTLYMLIVAIAVKTALMFSFRKMLSQPTK